jgi:hypothetical protein
MQGLWGRRRDLRVAATLLFMSPTVALGLQPGFDGRVRRDRHTKQCLRHPRAGVQCHRSENLPSVELRSEAASRSKAYGDRKTDPRVPAGRCVACNSRRYACCVSQGPHGAACPLEEGWAARGGSRSTSKSRSKPRSPYRPRFGRNRRRQKNPGGQYCPLMS